LEGADARKKKAAEVKRLVSGVLDHLRDAQHQLQLAIEELEEIEEARE